MRNTTSDTKNAFTFYFKTFGPTTVKVGLIVNDNVIYILTHIVDEDIYSPTRQEHLVSRVEHKLSSKIPYRNVSMIFIAGHCP